MHITRIGIEGYRGFAPHGFGVSPQINVLIGANNSGKSSILRAIFNAQKPILNGTDITIGTDVATVVLDIADLDKRIAHHLGGPEKGRIGQLEGALAKLTTNVGRESMSSHLLIHQGGANHSFQFGFMLSQDEPGNWIYPYLSERRVVNYQEEVKSQATKSVTGTHAFLYAKVDRLINPDDPHHQEFREACIHILGMPVSTFSASSGKVAGIVVDTFNSIGLPSMGTGTPQVLGILADLCVANNNVLLIEEIESDLHPRALKKLLHFLRKKAETNQIFITTHSHVVAKYLGQYDETKLFYVERDFKLQSNAATIKEVASDPQNRLAILENIGHELFDLDIWNAWLFLEEASAEKIIRDYLIPWFVPMLKNKLRTFSARSVDQTLQKFVIFQTLLTYVHLQEHVYKNRAWVYVDNDEKGRAVVQQLREKFSPSGWDEQNFSMFTKDKFERYYPAKFFDEIERVLNLHHDDAPKGKLELLNRVEEYLKTGGDEAKQALEKSANEVIEILKAIDASLVRSV